MLEWLVREERLKSCRRRMTRRYGGGGEGGSKEGEEGGLLRWWRSSLARHDVVSSSSSQPRLQDCTSLSTPPSSEISILVLFPALIVACFHRESRTGSAKGAFGLTATQSRGREGGVVRDGSRVA